MISAAGCGMLDVEDRPESYKRPGGSGVICENSASRFRTVVLLWADAIKETLIVAAMARSINVATIDLRRLFDFRLCFMSGYSLLSFAPSI